MVLVTIIGLTACGIPDNTTPTKPQNATTAPTEATTATKPSIEENWTKHFYVDDFNEPTSEWYISSEFSGTFSNSATNNSNLSCAILIDAKSVAFVLYEYGRSQVKNIYSKLKEYTIVTRTNSGERTFTGYIASGGDRIVIVDESSIKAIKNLLANSGAIKFYIYEADHSITNYLFQVKSGNLKDLLN